MQFLYQGESDLWLITDGDRRTSGHIHRHQKGIKLYPAYVQCVFVCVFVCAFDESIRRLLVFIGFICFHLMSSHFALLMYDYMFLLLNSTLLYLFLLTYKRLHTHYCYLEYQEGCQLDALPWSEAVQKATLQPGQNGLDGDCNSTSPVTWCRIMSCCYKWLKERKIFMRGTQSLPWTDHNREQIRGQQFVVCHRFWNKLSKPLTLQWWRLREFQDSFCFFIWFLGL